MVREVFSFKYFAGNLASNAIVHIMHFSDMILQGNDPSPYSILPGKVTNHISAAT